MKNESKNKCNKLLDTNNKVTENNKLKKPRETNGFCKQYVHYRTGKLMIAEEYGYKAWPF